MNDRSRPSLPLPPRRAATRAFTAAVLGVILATCGDATGPNEESADRLLFISDRAGEAGAHDIYSVNADGTGVENLTDAPAQIYANMSLSPDGETVAFYSDRSGCFHIWTMGTDGSAPTQLTGVSGGGNDRCNYAPRWSPDGASILFATTRDPESNPIWKLYVMDADGGNPRYVSSPVGEAEGGYTVPVGWSPDGRGVFHFWFGAGEGMSTYIVNADGTGLEPLFGGAGLQEPAWSPDGSELVHVRDEDGMTRLHKMNADGTDVRKLTEHEGHDWMTHGITRAWGGDYSPWSPDGSRIAFHNERDGRSILYVVQRDGSGLRALTGNLEHSATFNGWSPDGEWIAFSSGPKGADDIYLIRPDGTDLTNLTDSPADDAWAMWIPAE